MLDLKFSLEMCSDCEESYLLAFKQTIRLHFQGRSLQKVELIPYHLDVAMKVVFSSSIDFLYRMKYSPSVFEKQRNYEASIPVRSDK